VLLEDDEFDQCLEGTVDQAKALVNVTPGEVFVARPVAEGSGATERQNAQF